LSLSPTRDIADLLHVVPGDTRLLIRFKEQQVRERRQSAFDHRGQRDPFAHIGMVMIGDRDITVRFQKRAHNPFLIAVGFDRKEVTVPWLGRKRLVLQFG